MSRGWLLGGGIAMAATVGAWAVAGRPAPTLTCPEGTRRLSADTPAGPQAWCERAGTGDARIRHGPFAAWYPGGRPRMTGAYRDGEREGWWTFWHAGGVPSEAGAFRAGREDGSWTRWHPNGRPRESGSYREGQREGQWTFWLASGRPARAGAFRADQPEDPWRNWNARGDACETP